MPTALAFAIGFLSGAAALAIVVWLRGRLKSRRHAVEGMIERLQAPRHKPPTQSTLNAAVPALNVLLDRTLAARENLDKKAALIPTALGVAATVSLGRVNTAQEFGTVTVVAGLVTIGAAAIALIAAVAVLFPTFFYAGPDPEDTAVATAQDRQRFDQGLANALALSIDSVKSLVTWKGLALFISFASLTIAIGALTVFAYTGGFSVGAGPTD